MTSRVAIGGEFELAPTDFAPGPDGVAPPRFGRRVSTACNTGRGALRLVLRDWLGRGGSGLVWLPDYICPSIPSACLAEGCCIEYYADLPDAHHLAQPPAPKKNDAVMFAHYFGFVNRKFMAWLEQIPSNRDWTLIEDCVQAAYSDGVGICGDYAILSLRKWWPLPDGAAFVTDQPPRVDLPESNEVFVSMRATAKLLRGCGRPADEFLALVEQSEALLDAIPPCKMSWLSTRLLSHCDAAAMAVARRGNWRQLADAMPPGSPLAGKLTPLFPALQPNEVPLSFPVRVHDGRRDTLRAWLREQSIYCPVHWAVQPGPGITAHALTLAQAVLSLPIDQRYAAQDMERLVAALAGFFEHA